MIWVISAVILGVGLGVLGYYFSKTAYSLFVISMGLFVFLSSYAKSLMPHSASGVSNIDVPVNDSGMTDGIGLIRLMFNAVDNMGMLPTHIQLSIVVFIFSFFIARIGTWVFTKFNVQPERVETNTDRKQRILAQYGMKDLPR